MAGGKPRRRAALNAMNLPRVVEHRTALPSGGDRA
jgi:hypothetical protein